MSLKRNVPDAITVIHSRKSVRSFTGEAVSREDLEEILRAGMAAPSAVGRSPWELVVVTERATLDGLREGLPYAKMLDKAGAAVVVCGFPAKAHLQEVDHLRLLMGDEVWQLTKNICRILDSASRAAEAGSGYEEG